MEYLEIGIGQQTYRLSLAGEILQQYERIPAPRTSPLLRDPRGQTSGGSEELFRLDRLDHAFLLPSGRGVAAVRKGPGDGGSASLFLRAAPDRSWSELSIAAGNLSGWGDRAFPPIDAIASCVLLEDGSILVAWEDPWIFPSPLPSESHLAVSRDDGRTWSYRVLDPFLPSLHCDGEKAWIMGSSGFLETQDGQSFLRVDVEIRQPIEMQGRKASPVRHVVFHGRKRANALQLYWGDPFEVPVIGVLETVDDGRTWAQLCLLRGPDAEQDVNARHCLSMSLSGP